jgi:hypothetical protein
VEQREIDPYITIAAEYVTRLMYTPTLKASGQLPAFVKNYQAPGARSLRVAMINVLRGIEAVSGSRRMRSLPVPDLFRMDHYAPLRIIIKSVGAQGRARIFFKALPGMRFVFLLRHPCGQVASTARGLKQGKFDTGVFVRDVLGTQRAQRYGLTERRLNAAPHIEQLAWHWAIMNELVLDAMSGQENARLLLYENLCADPDRVTRDLFSFAGLGWHRQTQDFIHRSTSYDGNARYYSVFRNAAAAVNRWRSELSEQDQRVILDVVSQTSLGALWADITARHAANQPQIHASGI